MSRVIWKKLRLTGFGVYKEPVTVEFTEGINVFVAPNETGKTTLMNGLQSVLFGLPASSDPAKFGDTRFRNWDGAASFEGELEFSSGGIDYRIKRLFQDNRFYFQVKENGHWREELSGIHNPSARRPNLEYEGKLESLIGMISRVLFSSTFYLNQPLPETDQLDGEVQSLLSGSGGHYLAALEKLQEETRKLTRYTGTLGVTGRDGRVDGELEIVKSRLEELGQAWEESREGADNLQKLLVTARELEDRIESLQEELDQKDRLYQAWERWRFLHNRYRETTKKQLELRQAREKIREIIHKIEEGQENLRSDFPELGKAPEDLAGELENLIRKEEEKIRLENDQKEMDEEMESLAPEIDSLEARLQEEFHPFQANPRLLTDFQEFQRLSLAKRELIQKLGAINITEKEISQELQKMPDWGILGNTPASLLEMWRQGQPDPGEKWRQFQFWKESFQAIQEKIAGPLGIFQELNPDQEEALSSYTFRRLELEMDSKEKKLALEQAGILLASYQDMKRNFQDEYGDLEGLEQKDLDRKLVLLDELRHWQREKDLASKIFTPGGILLPLVSAMIGALTLAGAGWALGETFTYSVSGALLGGIAGWVVGRFFGRTKTGGSMSVRDIEARIASQEKELIEIDARLGSRAGAGEVKLGELRHRLKLRIDYGEKLKKLEKELPSPEELARLTGEAEAAGKALDNFHFLTKKFWEVFGGDISQAYVEYRELVAQKKRLQEDMERLAREEYGVALAGLEEVPVAQLKSSWETPLRLWRVFGEEGATLEDLIGWLEEREEKWWEEIKSSAATWEDYQSRLTALQAKKMELKERDSSGFTPLERIEEQIFTLEPRVSPFDCDTDLSYLRQLEQDYRQSRDSLLRLRNSREIAKKKKQKLQLARQELEVALAEKRQALKEYLEPAGGEPTASLRRLQLYQKEQQELVNIRRELQALLEGLQVENREELELKLLDTENEARNIWHQLEELTREHPGLPDHRSTIDRAELENDFQSLATARERLVRDRKDAEEELRQVLKEQARLEGIHPLNLAGAELELKELEEKMETLELESQALALAYRELEAAVEEYNLSYREHLNREATGYFCRFTGSQTRRVEIGEDFLLKIIHGGKKCLVNQLSQGARDQLYLSLRLAIASILSGEINLPLIFDDPFHNFDSRRLARVGETLQQIARDRQIIFLSHREDLTQWGAPVYLQMGEVI